jgi:hypothetical protein
MWDSLERMSEHIEALGIDDEMEAAMHSPLFFARKSKKAYVLQIIGDHTKKFTPVYGGS